MQHTNTELSNQVKVFINKEVTSQSKNQRGKVSP